MYYVKLLTKQGIYRTVGIKSTIEECEKMIINHGLIDKEYTIMDNTFNTIKIMKGGNDYECKEIQRVWRLL